MITTSVATIVGSPDAIESYLGSVPPNPFPEAGRRARSTAAEAGVDDVLESEAHHRESEDDEGNRQPGRQEIPPHGRVRDEGQRCVRLVHHRSPTDDRARARRRTETEEREERFREHGIRN